MTAMLDDPTAPTIYRVSGEAPFPEPYGALPGDMQPRQVTLRDRVTTATLVPFSSPQNVPPHLMAYLCELLNREIEKGDTYPMIDPMPLSSFGAYWFANFGAIMVVGDIQEPEEITQLEERGVDWAKQCLGSFYIKPNYPGRSSHVCNGGFLVTDAARNRGVGRLMGEGYLQWAPQLGYSYSVFNLVYETNVASLRIWDALGFKRIGRVKGCGQLKSYPDQLIDAIIFGRELGGDNDDLVTEERFDKIRFYLRTGTYPNGSDRAEKSRLRSAATHYRLIPGRFGNEDDEKLMLKGKEVISDPHKQYAIARDFHAATHGGINKTTATIAEKYHWVRIKETVSAAIKNCTECKESSPKSAPTFAQARRGASTANTLSGSPASGGRAPRQTVTASADIPSPDTVSGAIAQQQDNTSSIHQSQQPHQQSSAVQQPAQQQPPPAPMASMHYDDSVGSSYGPTPIDPQIMHGIHWDTGDQSMQLGGKANDMALDEDVEMTTRLREELEAQISSDSDAAYAREQVQRERNG